MKKEENVVARGFRITAGDETRLTLKLHITLQNLQLSCIK